MTKNTSTGHKNTWTICSALADALPAPSDSPAGFIASSSFHAWLPSAYAVLRSRFLFHFHRRESRGIRIKIRHAFGESLSSAEVRRLAVSAYAYREMARSDHSHPPHVLIDDPASLAGLEALFLGPSLLVPASFTHRSEFARGELHLLPAPLAAPEAATGIAETIKRAADRPIVFVRFVRTGLQSIRIELRPVNDSEIVAPMFDDAVRENIALYDWFKDDAIC